MEVKYLRKYQFYQIFQSKLLEIFSKDISNTSMEQSESSFQELSNEWS
jgi:hypothetical protein